MQRLSDRFEDRPRRAILGEVSVDVARDNSGGLIADRPEGADHVPVSGELERGGQLRGLVDLERASVGGAARGQIRQLRRRRLEVQFGDVVERERTREMVVEYQPAPTCGSDAGAS